MANQPAPIRSWGGVGTRMVISQAERDLRRASWMRAQQRLIQAVERVIRYHENRSRQGGLLGGPLPK